MQNDTVLSRDASEKTSRLSLNAAIECNYSPVPEELQYGEEFGYVVAFRLRGSPVWIQSVVPSVDASRYVFKNDSIPPLSQFEVKVGVYNSMGEGPFSHEVIVFSAEEGGDSFHVHFLTIQTSSEHYYFFLLSGITPFPEPSVAPARVWARSLSASEVQVFWEAVPPSRGKARITGYELEHPHTVPADGAVGVEVEGHQAFWTCANKPFILVLTTVPPHTDSLGVSTKTKAGLSCVVQPSANGAALTGGLMEDTTAGWMSAILAVESVQWWEEGSPESNVGKEKIAGSPARITGLKGSTVYGVSVRATNSGGVGPASIPVNITTKKPPPSQPPGNIEWNLTNSKIFLNWEHVKAMDNESEVTGYKLEHPHTVPADGAVGVEVKWTCDNNPFILVLTTVPPHTDSLGVSTKTKAGLVVYRQNWRRRTSVVETNRTSVELQVPSGEDLLIQIKASSDGGDGSYSSPIRIPKMS
ncbi:hypothetical protein NFI96_008504, partial [Prochilodus magdalenae]